MLSQESTYFGEVEPYQQIWNYSCGAAALKAVMKHWGEDVDEPTLIREVGVDPKRGSTAAQVTNAAQQHGYLARTIRFDTIDELGAYTNRDMPVILAIRSFTRPNQGHFVVATKVTPKVVEIMDPNVAGNQRTLPRSELDRRWQFRDRVGVVVTPRKRNQFGVDAAPRFTRAQTAALAVVSAVVLTAAATVGVVIYRRRRKQAS